MVLIIIAMISLIGCFWLGTDAFGALGYTIKIIKDKIQGRGTYASKKGVGGRR